jgi:glycosyltransferase involved in cell wall biosynthesis
MHVFAIIDSLVPAGAETSLAALVPKLVAKGVTLDVAYLHDLPGLQSELEAAGANLVDLAGRGGRAGWIVRARRAITRRRPDLVHTTLFEADVAGRVAARSLSVPVVSSLVGVSYDDQHRSDPSLKTWKIRAAQIVDVSTARLVTRFHAPSILLADAMAPSLRIPRRRIEVVPRGRDPEALGTRSALRSRRVRAAIGVGDSRPIVLAVARHEHKKGLDILLSAFALVRRKEPNARLIIAGKEGSQTASLRDQMRDLALTGSVHMLGSRGDVPDLLCAADVFVLPSRSEGFPGALIEAMALEAPIVAGDISPVREIAADSGAAIIARGDDPDSFATAILETLADPVAASERGRRGRRRFLARYTVDRIAEGMLGFYQRALREARGNDPARRPPTVTATDGARVE